VENKIVKIIKDDSTPATPNETSADVREGGPAHIMTNQDEGLKIKAVHAGNAISDFVESTFDKTIKVVKSKANELYKSGALEPGYAAARKDSADIARLGPLVTGLATEFEQTITMVCEHSYSEQVHILMGYKKLLEEQINVIDSRSHFVKRVS